MIDTLNDIVVAGGVETQPPSGTDAENSLEMGGSDSELQIPDSWGPGIRELLNQTSDINSKKALYDRAKDLEGRYDKRNSEFATERKTFESQRDEWRRSRAEVEAWDGWLKSISAAERDAIRKNYGSEADYIKHLHNLDRMAESNLEEFAANILRGMGIDVENFAEKIPQLLGGAAGARVDMDAKYREFEQKTEERIKAEFNKRQAEQEYSEFINSKNPDGSPMFPHFDNPEIKKEMGGLIKVEAYQNLSLPALYDMAIKIKGLASMETEAIKTAAAEVERKKSAAGIPEKTNIPGDAKKRETSTEFLMRNLKNIT